MTVKPLGERVLVKAEMSETKTAGGIFIPQTSQEKTQIAQVIATGDKVQSIKVGERILHDKYAGTNVKVDGEDYLILDQKDILAVIC